MSTVVAKGEVKPWMSLSSLWGQGGTGVSYKDSPYIYNLRYNFVWDWSDREFQYHQIAPSIDLKDYTVGFKYRYQLEQYEYTPFVGYFYRLKTYLPVSLYSEVEYRIDSVVKDENYVRSRHIFSIYAPKTFQKKYFIRPYIAWDSFVDWDEADFEKNRLNIGYFMAVKKIKARIYVIPWSNGIEEQEWDDRSSFGASMTYLW